MSAATTTGLSLREFARRDHCDEKLVRRAVGAGRLVPFADGTLDAALVSTGWRKANRRAQGTANAGTAAGADIPGQAADIAGGDEAARAATLMAAMTVPGGRGLLSLAGAEQVKENYLARLRQLEFRQKSGAVVSIAEVAKQVGEEYARVRTRLLAIPAEQAPRLHRCRSVAELVDALMDVICEALEELAFDRRDPGAG